MRRTTSLFASMVVAAVAASPLLSQEVDRTKVPVLGPPPSLHLPPIAVRTMPNGLKLMIVERHELPVADMVLVVPFGATASPADKAGIADLTAGMLTAGTPTRSALAIADQAAFLGASVAAGSGWDATNVVLSTPTAKLDSAMALFADVALHPTFPDSEFARSKQTRLTSLLQLKDRGPAIANQAYAAILFGDSPYGRPVLGTEATVGALTSRDLASFYRAHFVPDGATLIVVGDVTPAEMEARVKKLFGAWSGKAPEPEAQPMHVIAPAPTTIYLIDKPGAAQSSFRIGEIGVPRSTSDYYALRVANTALGGSFTSRLNQNLREVKGYTYGAGSRFDMRKGAGPFTASAEVVTAKTDSALIEFMKELRAIRDTIPTAELTKTKRYMELTLPAEFETTSDVANQLADVALYGLPLDYYNHAVQSIEAVSQADARRVANAHIDPEHLAIVIVGDRKTIEAPLRALGIAPVSIRDMNGAPIQ